MIITSLIMMVAGVLFILRSSALSGRALRADDLLSEGGFMLLVRHIFMVRPFAGYHTDKRILYFGLSGVLMLGCGIVLFVYVLMWIYTVTGGR